MGALGRAARATPIPIGRQSGGEREAHTVDRTLVVNGKDVTELPHHLAKARHRERVAEATSQ